MRSPMPLRLIRLLVGLFIFALGLVLSINAQLGLSSWNCLNSGIIKWIPIRFGQANIAVGVLLIIITYFAKEKIGIGTISNMLFVGIFIDVIVGSGIIPISQNLVSGIAMVLLGLLVSAIGVFLYLGAGFGAGPRDGLMLALMKWTGRSLPQCRTAIECVVLVIGMALGGSFGIGTVIAAGLNGAVMQTTFKLCKFNPKELKHQYIDDFIKDYFRKGSN